MGLVADEGCMEPRDADERTGAAGNGRDGATVALDYYDALDAGDYDRLASILAPEFVHDRPDRTFEGRESFVAFMRDGRPETDTRHEVVESYRAVERDGRVVRGRLVGADGEVRFEFVDVFAFEGDRIGRIETFTR